MVHWWISITVKIIEKNIPQIITNTSILLKKWLLHLITIKMILEIEDVKMINSICKNYRMINDAT
jgi:hypothetical protein